jgi:putative ABC transport system permease protein
MLTDLRLALRAFRTRPGFVAAVVLCLALGIGVNSTVYSLVNAVLLRPLPYRAPGELVAAELVKVADGQAQAALALPTFADVRDGARTLASVAAFTIRTVSLRIGSEPEGLDAAAVTGGYFATLGVPAALGRTFGDAEVRTGERVVVLAHPLWTRRFGGDPGVVGRTLSVNGVPHTVIGVMPPSYALTNDVEQLWLPLDADDPTLQRGDFAYRVIGRLAPGATAAMAAAELRGIGDRISAEHPETHAGLTVRAVPLREHLLPPSIRTVMLVMLGAVTMVLLIACANVANLMLGHALGRTRELAVRTALGAGRGRLVRQLLTESVLLGLAGGVAGAVLAVWGLRATLTAFPFQFPPWLVPSVDVRVLIYTAVVAAASGVVFGLVPALHAGRVDPQTVLRDGSRGTTGGRGRARLRDGLVAAQLAFSLVLLAGAALMMKSFVLIQRVDPGFDPEGVLAVQLMLGGDRGDVAARRAATFGDVRERLAGLPGVIGVSAAPYAPTAGGASSSRLTIEGRAEQGDRRPSAEVRPLLGDYFADLRVPLRRGRAFTAAEALDSASRVVVINEEMAARLWPGEEAIGRRLSWDGDAWHTVVGVVADSRQRGLGTLAGNQLYVPYAARPMRTMTFLVRVACDAGSACDPGALAGAAGRRIRRCLDRRARGGDAPRAGAPLALAGAPLRASLRRLRGGGAAAGQRGAVRRRGQRHPPAHARDRGPRGARRARRGRLPPGLRPQPGAGRRQSRRGARAGRRAHARPGVDALRRVGHGRERLRTGDGDARHGRAGGDLDPRPPRRTRGPPGGAAGGVRRRNSEETRRDEGCDPIISSPSSAFLRVLCGWSAEPSRATVRPRAARRSA